MDTPRPSPRTNRTRRVPHPVLIGHAASVSQAADAREGGAAPQGAGEARGCLAALAEVAHAAVPLGQEGPAGYEAVKREWLQWRAGLVDAAVVLAAARDPWVAPPPLLPFVLIGHAASLTPC